MSQQYIISLREQVEHLQIICNKGGLVPKMREARNKGYLMIYFKKRTDEDYPAHMDSKIRQIILKDWAKECSKQ